MVLSGLPGSHGAISLFSKLFRSNILFEQWKPQNSMINVLNFQVSRLSNIREIVLWIHFEYQSEKLNIIISAILDLNTMIDSICSIAVTAPHE